MNAAPGMVAPDATVSLDSQVGPRYYSVAEAASFLGVSRVTIWRWVKAGRLPICKLGHRTARLKREDLERLLAERKPGRGGMASAQVADALAVADAAIVATGAALDD